ncbi:MAG TPA: hypothetical protein VN428_27270 [Bryobacteraceae bacterium]|nr:hypothetical protein [Bryobacteraceae bacterium]
MRILSTHGHETEERPDRHEQKDANTKGLWWFLAALMTFLVISVLAMAGLYRFFGAQPGMAPEQLTPLAPALQMPPTPRLQTLPQLDMDSMRAREDRVLSTYGWVDQSAGIVRIPIDRAIDMLAQRGLPARASGQQAAPSAPATGPESGGRQTGGASPRTESVPGQSASGTQSAAPGRQEGR